MKIIVKFLIPVFIFFSLLMDNAIAARCDGIRTTPAEGSPLDKLGKSLFKGAVNPLLVTCEYLGTPYSLYGLEGHSGIDYRILTDSVPVYAISSGEVVTIGGNSGQVSIKMSDGSLVNYLHLSEISIPKGQISAGTKIGMTGSVGANNHHLHIEIINKNYSSSNPIATGSSLCGGWCSLNDEASRLIDPTSISSASISSAPEFHGAGSLISPTQNCFGCNKDTDAIHATGKAGLVLFQWYYTPSQCDHIDISVDNMSYGKTVEIRSGAWDSRSSDKSYVATLPVSVEADGRTPWNVTAIKLDPFTSPASLTAKCSVSSKVGTKTVKPNSNSLGIDLENGWIWQGNASLISNISGTGFGITQDVVNLSHPKGAAFFQWQKSFQCQNLKITAAIPGNYKLRMRAWDSSPVPTASKPLVLSRDVYLSSNQATVLNYAEVAATFNTGYYLLSVYSDINIIASVLNPINVSCSTF